MNNNRTETTTLTHSERVTREMEAADREFRLFSTPDNDHLLFGNFKEAEEAWEQTATGINALFTDGKTELATAYAIAHYGYDGNSASVRALRNAAKTTAALEEVRVIKDQILSIVEQIQAAKQSRSKQRAQEEGNEVLESLRLAARAAERYADTSAVEAISAETKAHSVPTQGASAQRAYRASERAKVEASLAARILACSTEALADDGNDGKHEVSFPPNTGDELSGEVDEEVGELIYF